MGQETEHSLPGSLPKGFSDIAVKVLTESSPGEGSASKLTPQLSIEFSSLAMWNSPTWQFA